MGSAISGAVSQVGGALVGGLIQNRAARRSSRAGQQETNNAIEEQRLARQAFLDRTQFAVDLGGFAGDELKNLLSNPNAGLEQINPIVDFLRKEGFNDIQESAAAGGRLGAGGTLRDLTQFNSDLTSTVIPQLQNQRFNQLFNVLGLGTNAATGQGNAFLSTANNIGNLFTQRGIQRQQGIQGRADAQTGFIENASEAAGSFFGSGSGGGFGGF